MPNWNKTISSSPIQKELYEMAKLLEKINSTGSGTTTTTTTTTTSTTTTTTTTAP